ncbi:TPA: family 16 glycosylhydrolase [Streptococcus suis]
MKKRILRGWMAMGSLGALIFSSHLALMEVKASQKDDLTGLETVGLAQMDAVEAASLAGPDFASDLPVDQVAEADQGANLIQLGGSANELGDRQTSQDQAAIPEDPAASSGQTDVGLIDEDLSRQMTDPQTQQESAQAAAPSPESSDQSKDPRVLDAHEVPESENAAPSPIKASSQSDQWTYYGGDEFNDQSLDPSKWGVFDNDGTYGQPQGMIQYYQAGQVQELMEEDGTGALHIISERDQRTIQTPEGQVHQAWNSGFITSGGRYTANPPQVFYPLYFRLEMRAKIANEAGFWHGLWLTHYDGASVAELDLGEFFVNAFPKGQGQDKVTQTIHLFNNKTGKVEKNLPRGKRTFQVSPGVQDHYKDYAVSVQAGEKENEAVITFWVDNQVTYSFSTDSMGDNVLNRFITKTKQDGREMSTWNIMFQGGVGSDGGADVGYPEEGISQVRSAIDYIRVFVPKVEGGTDQATKDYVSQNVNLAPKQNQSPDQNLQVAEDPAQVVDQVVNPNQVTFDPSLNESGLEAGVLEASTPAEDLPPVRQVAETVNDQQNLLNESSGGQAPSATVIHYPGDDLQTGGGTGSAAAPRVSEVIIDNHIQVPIQPIASPADPSLQTLAPSYENLQIGGGHKGQDGIQGQEADLMKQDLEDQTKTLADLFINLVMRLLGIQN